MRTVSNAPARLPPGAAGVPAGLPAVSAIRRHLRALLPVLAVLAIVPAYLHPYRITPGGASEVPTILPGDVIIVNTAAYHLYLPYSRIAVFRTGVPRRGEMVLVTLPDHRHVAPKRVIGVPGDTIEIKNNRIIIDGQMASVHTLNRAEFAWVPKQAKLGSVVEDENGHWITYTPGTAASGSHPLLRLASGQYFVLGDNRDQSADSRIWGPIADAAVVGRVAGKFAVGPRR